MNLARDIQNAYQELDLTPGASLDEVKLAYRRLARALHPDLNPGAMGSLMKRVNHAYDKLLRHLDGQQLHQAGPARADRENQAKARPKQARSHGFQEYQYEEFKAERGAHGEHVRRDMAWQNLKRKFYEQARKAAQAAEKAKETQAKSEPQPTSAAPQNAPNTRFTTDEAQVVSPSDPRTARAKAAQEEPAAGPVGLSWRATQGWRLLGLEKHDKVLLYKVEVSGRPGSIDLPVRCCRPCAKCQGAGRFSDASGRQHRCPACGGRGRITRADRVEVELPRNWEPGQRIEAAACNSESIITVELNQAAA
jgi:DnaJ-class molecular chaperone